MATPDFSKIWASASPLPTFTFTDAEYTEGWDFVGSAPPTKNQFDAWFRYVDERLKWLYDQMQATASKLYPVGSVYISFNATDPSTLFGGTWVRLKDRFLLASGDTYAANTTGGSATKTIAVSNMPAHNHSVNASGNHSHTATTSAAGNHTHTGTTSRGGEHSHTMYAAYPGKVNAGARGICDTGDGTIQGFTGTTSSAGNHNHSFTTSNAGAHTHTIGNTGSGTAFNTISPYITAYVWRRTA